jgi:hypothetical protein
MIITSHLQNIIQIYTCLLKLLRKQESVTDGQTDDRYYYIPSPLSRWDKKTQLIPICKKKYIVKIIVHQTLPFPLI